MAKIGTYYLIQVFDDVDPYLHGPYKTAQLRDQVARQIRHTQGDENGLYRLRVTDKTVSIGAFSGIELEPDAPR